MSTTMEEVVILSCSGQADSDRMYKVRDLLWGTLDKERNFFCLDDAVGGTTKLLCRVGFWEDIANRRNQARAAWDMLDPTLSPREPRA